MKDRVSLPAGRDFRMSGIRRAFVLAVLACGSLVSACGDSPSEEQAAAPKSTPGKPAKLAGLPPEMVAAVPANRSSTAVTVHFALGKPPVVGEAVPVEIAIVPHQDFTSLRAHFVGAEAVAVTVGDAMAPVSDVKLETVIKHQLVLLPSTEGIFMISASLETESPSEGTVSRVFSLPMIVSGAGKPAPTPAPTPPTAQ